MAQFNSSNTIYITKEERKILELALPILMCLANESEYFWESDILEGLCRNYDDNNGKLSAVIDLD